MLPNTAIFVSLLIAIAAFGAHAQTAPPVDDVTKARRECKRQKSLVCILSPVSGSSISGKILFTPAFRRKGGNPECYVRIRAKVEGLTGTRHGFHIHEYGDISALDGTSTGGHFGNPDGTPAMHGYPDDDDRHWGDFGNLRNRGGMATYNRVDKIITLQGIVGHGITIHEGKDQGAAEQPSGGSGPRQAVCVIGFANPGSLTI